MSPTVLGCVVSLAVATVPACADNSTLTGTCQPSSGPTVLQTGTNIDAYVPKGHWTLTLGGDEGDKGIGVVRLEGLATTPKLIRTGTAVNSCAANSVTGMTVCTSNGTDVYLLRDATIAKTLTDKGVEYLSFFDGVCRTCGVAMDAAHNKAFLGLGFRQKDGSGAFGFQVLDLSTESFEPPFASPSSVISEGFSVDPARNLLLSASFSSEYELANIANTRAPQFFEFFIRSKQGLPNVSVEDCATGIAMATTLDDTGPTDLFQTDLTQASFKPDSPSGRWSAPWHLQYLADSKLSDGAPAAAIAQGTHTGIVSGNYGGNKITAIALPTTSGTGKPEIQDWVTCRIRGLEAGRAPQPVTAYQSPNGDKDAKAVLTSGPNGIPHRLFVVDLTKMLSNTDLPRDATGHHCSSENLPASIVSSVPVP